MMERLDAAAFATAASVVSAVVMLLLGIIGNMSIYTGAVDMMMEWHLFFTLSIDGIITGMLEAAVITFMFCYAFVCLYNVLLART